MFLNKEQISGEAVEIRFIPLSAFTNDFYLNGNAKKHNDEGLKTAIVKYGFIDPPKWDNTLNGGNGALVFGNGRTEAVISILKDLKSKKGSIPPRGIPTTANGDWAIPVTCGVDCSSEAIAIALGIDHNNLVISHISNHDELMKMYDEDLYKNLLIEVAKENELPVTENADDVASLLLALAETQEPVIEVDREKSGTYDKFHSTDELVDPLEGKGENGDEIGDKQKKLVLKVMFENADDMEELRERLNGEGYNVK